jgi:hypothetical protein
LRTYKTAIEDGNIPIDVNRSGEIVVALGLPRERGDTESPSGIAVGLTHDGVLRWQYDLNSKGVLLGPLHSWSTEDGGALLHVSATPLAGSQLTDIESPPGAVIGAQERLYRLSSTGELLGQLVLTSNMMPEPSKTMALADLSTLGNDPDALRAVLEHQQNLMTIEAVDQIAAYSQADGGIGMLVKRGSSSKFRNGTFYIWVDKNGKAIDELYLQPTLVSQGLNNWTDFVIDSDQLFLYGVTGTQENRLPQGYLSRINLTEGTARTILAPLGELGYAEARNAPDEQIKNLEHNPGQQPVMLSWLGRSPLLISLIRQSRRPALQLDEATEHLERIEP